MSSSPLFIDSTSGTLDTDQLIREAIPLSKLIGSLGLIALIPFAIASTTRLFGGVFILLTQFLLAIGSALVILYVITRALQLSEE